MIYVIDGYNLLFHLDPEANPLRRSREEILDLLAKVSHLKLEIVFDSDRDNALDIPSRTLLGNLDIVFSPRGQSADDWILEYLATRKRPKLYCLVTHDRELINGAKELGVKVMATSAFVKKLAPRKRNFDKTNPLTPKETEELRTIFEQNFDDGNE